MTQEKLAHKIEYLRELETKYQESSRVASVSDKAKDTYREWYNATISLFHECGLDDNEDNRWLVAQGIPVSGVDMFKVFNAFHPKFRLLLNDIQNGKYPVQEQETEMTVKSAPAKRPLVFISHSGKQKVFVKALVELFESCGFCGENMFCSSVPGFNIDEGEDIVDTLRKKFVDYKLYVIYVLSSDFFDKPYCMNEVGAAWVLQAANSIIETCDLDDSKIDGVISKTKNRISFKNDDDDNLFDKMVELRDKLLCFADIPKVSETNWWRYYNIFLQKLSHQVEGKPRKAVPAPHEPAKPALTYSTESIDSIISNAINKLGEFTMAELQKETKIENSYHLQQKINAMVKSGDLEAVGSTVHKKYKRIYHTNQLF